MLDNLPIMNTNCCICVVYDLVRTAIRERFVDFTPSKRARDALCRCVVGYIYTQRK